MLRQDEAFTVLAVARALTGLRRLGETESGNPFGVALSNSPQLSALDIPPVGLAVEARLCGKPTENQLCVRVMAAKACAVCKLGMNIGLGA